MKPRFISLLAAVALSLSASASASGEGDCHFHGSTPAKQETVSDCAAKRQQQTTRKLAPSPHCHSVMNPRDCQGIYW